MVKVRDRLDGPGPYHKQMIRGHALPDEPVIEKLADPLSGFMKRFRTRKPQHTPRVSPIDWNVRV